MDVCRICLTADPAMDIFQVHVGNKNDNQSFVDVLLFCLDIKVTEDSKMTTKICTKCYKKTISFNKFKCFALKNDSYLKANSDNTIVNNETVEIKFEETSITSDDNYNDIDDQVEVKKEQCVKIEDRVCQDSDDELLSVIKEIKYEFIPEEETNSKEVKRKRGRPRKNPIEKSISNERKICETCGKTYRNLVAHLKLHQPKNIKTCTEYKCSDCNKIFKAKVYRDRHFKRKHTGLGKSQCNLCKKLVGCLKSHHLRVHDKESLPFKCLSCGQRFLSRAKLAEHMSCHSKERPYECNICKKRFRIKLSLTTHIRGVHDNEKTHLCQFCSKSFFKKYHLQIHLRSHTKEKPYECKECGKFFSSTSTLKNHLMVHSDVKVYNCELCDMSFVRSGYLTAHMVSHIKEKRYPCEYCGARFHRSDHRKRHEWTAHKRHLANSVMAPDH